MKTYMKRCENSFFNESPRDLQWELTMAIVNHRTLSETDKQTTLWQYYNNLITNGVVVDRLNTEVR